MVNEANIIKNNRAGVVAEVRVKIFGGGELILGLSLKLNSKVTKKTHPRSGPV